MKNIDYVNIYLENFERNVNQHRKSQSSLNVFKYALKKLKDWKDPDDLIEQINAFLKSRENTHARNSLCSYRSIYKVFVEFYSKRIQTFIDFDNRVCQYKIQLGTRNPFSKEELEIIYQELKNYNDIRFEIICKIFAYTGIRISEWDNIDWPEFIANDFKIMLEPNKGSKLRPFVIPDGSELKSQLIYALNKGIKFKISSKRVANLFSEFNKFVHKNHPEFRTKITSHVFRHCYSTEIDEQNEGDLNKTARMTGHVNPLILDQVYIRYNKIKACEMLENYQKHFTIYKLENGTENEQVPQENDKIAEQAKEIEALKNDIKELKMLLLGRTKDSPNNIHNKKEIN